MRDEIDTETIPRNLVHRQRDAVQCDRPLGRDEARKRLGRFQRHTGAVALVADFGDGRNPIDVA